MHLPKRRVPRDAVQTKRVALHHQTTPGHRCSCWRSPVQINRTLRPRLRQLRWQCSIKLRLNRPFSPAQSGPRIRRRRSRSSAFVSSDPKSLTPEVCPITGTSRVQTLFRTDENTLPTILLFSFSFNRQTKSHQRCSCVFAEHVCLGCRHARASQAAFLRRRNDGHAGKR